MTGVHEVRAPRGTHLSCKGWPQEAALRMLMNNLDPDVAERPEELIVYGGTGKAARSWEAFDQIVRALRSLEDDETLLIQSGKPVGVFKTQPSAPRVLISNAMLVPKWADWETFWQLEAAGLTMYGQMTAGSWIYIGSQGILQGTYETLGELAAQRFGGSLKGRIVLTAGLGGMGGAQPLAVTMNEGVALVVEVDPARIERRIKTRYLDRETDSLDEAVGLAEQARHAGEAVSIGLLGNAAEVFPELLGRDFPADVVTDQTSAHDPVGGYVPAGLTLDEALALRRSDPDEYRKRSYESMARHCEAMVGFRDGGAVVFDYGNNLRGGAKEGGFDRAFAYPGFVPAFIRPMFCQGKGPFRWVALSGDAADILATDRVVSKGEVSAPIVIGRDHLDAGSVASPYRETEGMKDGSDAIADWPILNALLNTAAGAHWVSVHHGGGVGIGYSIHAGMVVVADGSEDAAGRLQRVLTTDPGTGVIRHADAGYDEALQTAKDRGVRLPWLE